MSESKLENNKIALCNLEQLESIKNSPLMKSTVISVLKAVPLIGELIDSSIDSLLTEFQNKKRMELLEIIISSDSMITSEKVNDIEFIINFAKTLEAVSRLSTNDKVCYFANLLKNSYFSEDKASTDTYDEYLSILNDISFREIQYVCFLYKNPIGKSKKSRNWGKFKEAFVSEFLIDKKMVYPIFYRLKRTGFVDEILSFSPGTISGDEKSGYELDSGDIDTDYFFTTETFEKFAKVVIDI